MGGFSALAFSRLAFAVSSTPRYDESAYAGAMTALLPPGRLWRLAASTLRDLFLACAAELSRVDGRAADLRNEADPTTTNELLPEFERELDLDAGALTADERRARVVGRLVARQRFRPVDIQSALAALLGQLSASVVVIERSLSSPTVIADGRAIFRFFVYRNPTLPGAYFVASAQALLGEIMPSHTAGYVIESISFLTDDPFSLTDRDILGA